MILDMMALLIPQPSITLDGVEHTENVNVIRLSGEHEVTGNFGFIQMTPQDYEWLKREELNSSDAQHAAEVNALTVELVEKDYQILTGEELI
jgi:hypothetical protein